MASPQQQSRMTAGEYLAFERNSDIRHEFVDGEIRAMVGASKHHIIISDNAFAYLHGKLQGGPCRAFHADLKVYVQATGGYFYPDMTIVCGEPRFDERENAAVLLNPSCLVEVLSPSTEAFDRGKKFLQYQQIPSLADYVLISQDMPLIARFSRQTDSTWILHQAQGRDAVIDLPASLVTMPLRVAYDGVTFADA